MPLLLPTTTCYNLQDATTFSGQLPPLSCAQPLRLWLGYTGNLRERVPALATFLLVTFLPAMPICIYMGWLQAGAYAFDRALGTAWAALLLAQVLAGAGALRGLARSEEAKFYLLDASKAQ